MTHAPYTVNVFRSGPGWAYRVLGKGGHAVATRGGYASFEIARTAGQSAASAFAPKSNAIRFGNEAAPTPSRMPVRLTTPKRGLWGLLTG